MFYKIGIAISAMFILMYFVLRGQAFFNAPKYVTWEGIEPDKWASVWLIKKQISPDSEIEVRPMHARTDDGIAFDVPDSKFYRNSQRSTYASLLSDYQGGVGVSDPVLIKIGDIIQDMDVNVWADKTLPETPKLENAIRTLQQNYNRISVPPSCYYELFDRAYVLLSKQLEITDLELNEVVQSCGRLAPHQSITRNNSIVAEVPVDEVLRQIDMGKKVMFVDTRESEEFDEMHIPGAVNIKLRDVNQKLLPSLQGYDLVISYCVKDFRGYEVARAIGELGVANSSIMRPYGIRGWNDLGLPVFSTQGLNQNDSLAALKECASNPKSCLEAF